MSGIISKRDLLSELGYSPPHGPLDQALCEAGLTSVKKVNISLDKRHAVEAALRSRFTLTCRRGDCLEEAQRRGAQGQFQRVLWTAVSQDLCEICGGSVISAAAASLVAACQRAGWRRLCIVGGSPAARTRIEEEAGGKLELRLIDGTGKRTQQDARADLTWADHIVIWASTQLAHRVSAHYQGRPTCSTVDGRGIADLLAHIEKQALRVAGAK